MSTYKNTVDIDKGVSDSNNVKGSEWNRMILPLIGVNGKETSTTNRDVYTNNSFGRFGEYSMDYVEQNMPTLANYTWWKDFGGNRNLSGDYRMDDGIDRWMYEENLSNSFLRVSRGDFYMGEAAATLRSDLSGIAKNSKGWLPVLELVKDQ